MSRASIALLAFTLTAAAPDVLAGDPLPHSVTLTVRAGDRAAPHRLREELEQALLDRLLAKACFERTQIAAPDAPSSELLVELTVAQYEEQQFHDEALSSVHDSSKPPSDEATMSFSIEGTIETRVLTAQNALVRGKRTVQKIDFRPTIAGEDREDAYEQWIHEVARKASAFLCSGTPKKWREEIARAGAPPR